MCGLKNRIAATLLNAAAKWRAFMSSRRTLGMRLLRKAIWMKSLYTGLDWMAV